MNGPPPGYVDPRIYYPPRPSGIHPPPPPPHPHPHMNMNMGPPLLHPPPPPHIMPLPMSIYGGPMPLHGGPMPLPPRPLNNPRMNQPPPPASPIALTTPPPGVIFPPSTPTNVFVGKLPPDIHDNYIRGILERCGTVLSWKRMTDNETRKAKGFGYCTYAAARDVLRALRLLNGFIIDSKEVIVKVDSKTRESLDEYETKLSPEIKQMEDDIDKVVKASLRELYEERSGIHGGKQNDLSSWGVLVDESIRQPESREANKDDKAQKVQGNVIMSEIEKFRLAQDQREKEKAQKRKEAIQEKLRREEENRKRKEALAKETEQRQNEKTKYREDRQRSRSRSKSHGRRRNRSRSRSRSGDVRKRKGHHERSKSKEKTSKSSTIALPEKRTEKIVVGLKLAGTKSDAPKSAPTVAPSLFKEEDVVESAALRPLVLLDYTEEEKIASSSKDLKALVKKIPTKKEDLFATEIKWNIVEKYGIFEENLKKWIENKMEGYLGSEGKPMADFVYKQLLAKTKPEEILDGLQPVLDDEADMFVRLLWRKLIFEILRYTS